MTGLTYRIITLWFCLLFGLVWIWMSWRLQAMYVPPVEVQRFMGLLLAGKLFQSVRGYHGANITG